MDPGEKQVMSRLESIFTLKLSGSLPWTPILKFVISLDLVRSSQVCLFCMKVRTLGHQMAAKND
jgi:hypothetical protein